MELENIQRIIEAESEIVNESIEDVEEDRTEMDIIRTSERNEQTDMIWMKQQIMWLLMLKH